MGVAQRIHPALCSAFINQSLLSRPGLALHETRFFQEVNIPEPTELKWPYIFWTGGVRQVAQHSGRREHVGKLTSIYTVRAVRRYPSGGADWADFDADYHELRDALTGVECTPVRVKGQTLGHIFQSRYLTDFEQSFREDGIRILEKGIVIEIIHR